MAQITVSQAAATLKISERRVRALIAAGKLRADKIAGVWLTTDAFLDALIADRRYAEYLRRKKLEQKRKGVKK